MPLSVSAFDFKLKGPSNASVKLRAEGALLQNENNKSVTEGAVSFNALLDSRNNCLAKQ
jgi:hypothetical protein